MRFICYCGGSLLFHSIIYITPSFFVYFHDDDGDDVDDDDDDDDDDHYINYSLFTDYV